MPERLGIHFMPIAEKIKEIAPMLPRAFILFGKKLTPGGQQPALHQGGRYQPITQNTHKWQPRREPYR